MLNRSHHSKRLSISYRVKETWVSNYQSLFRLLEITLATVGRTFMNEKMSSSRGHDPIKGCPFNYFFGIIRYSSMPIKALHDCTVAPCEK